MNNLLYYIGEYFKSFESGYVIYLESLPTDSCNVTEKSITFFIDDTKCKIEKEQIAEVSITATNLTIKTKCHKEYNFVAKPLSKNEKMEQVILELRNRLICMLPPTQYSLFIEPYIDKLKQLNNE